VLAVAAFALLTDGAGAQPASNIAIDDTLTDQRDLLGPDYRIDESMGAQTGPNLFFSFSRFGLEENESATFAGPASIERVISRVTGPEESEIHGTLRSEIADADVYLLNPNGVVFGKNARLDIPGAFHASTADMLEFEKGVGEQQGGEFHARHPELTVLSMEPIAAFNFLADDPATIEIRGSQLQTGRLEPVSPNNVVARGEDFSLIGGDVQIHGNSDTDSPGFVFTAGGRLDIVSLDSAGRVEVASGTDPIVTAAGALGDVSIGGGAAVVTGGPSPVDPRLWVNGSGDVFIRARHLTLEDAEVRAITTSHKAAGRIRVELDGDFHAGAAGRSETTGLIAGSGLQIGDPDAPYADQDFFGVRFPDATRNAFQFVFKNAEGDPVFIEHIAQGAGGSIKVSARNVSLVDGAKLSSSGVFGGDGGAITVEAEGVMTLSGADVDGEVGGIFSNAQRGGSGGSIEVTAADLVLDDRAGIFSEVREGDGAGGSIDVTVDRLSIDGSGRIDTSTRGTGAGGRVDVTARESISMRGRLDVEEFSGITTISQPEATGNAGSLEVEAPIIELADGASISTASRGTGDAGGLVVRGDTISLRASSIESSVTGEAAGHGGSGGDLSIEATRLFLDDAQLLVDNKATADDESGAAPPGGSVSIDAVELIDSRASTISAKSAAGPGGNVLLASAGAIVLRDGTVVLANAPLGKGGRIEVTTDLLLISADSMLDASGGEEGGEVVINSPEADLQRQVRPPPAEFLDASAMLLATCAARRTGERAGSLTVARWRGIPLSPEGPLLAFGRIDAEAATAGRSETELSPESIDVAIGAGDPLRGDALRGSAQSHQRQGEFAASLAPLEEALALARASGEASREAAALGDLGNAYQALREPERAARYLEEAVSIARRGGDAELATLLNNLGNHYAIEGHAAESLAAYDESAALARITGDRLREAQSSANASRAALELGREAEAAERLVRAQTLLSEGEPTRESVSLRVHMGVSWAKLAASAGARRREGLLPGHRLLTRAIADAGTLGDARLLSHAQGNLAALYEFEGNRDREAIYLTREAQRAAERAEAPDLLARWHQQAGRILWAAGETDAALASYRRAEALLDEARPEATARYGTNEREFEREVAPIYLTLVDALLQRSAADPVGAQASLREARAVVERWKAAELRDYFRDECVAELEATARPVEEISRTTAVVYPILLPDRLELLVSLPTGIERRAVAATEREVVESVTSFRRAVTKRASRRYLRHAQQLYEWLVEPYAEALAVQEIDTLVFVPDGPLRTIPIAALHDGERFLIERYAVALTPSLNLIAPKQLDPSNARILLAGVSEEVQGYSELPSVPGELASIQALYGGELLLNDAFRTGRLEEELRERPPGVVHLASHAEFTGDPRSSFVLTHDGRLTMDRLSDLVESGRFGDEPLELLVLSACRTAAGDERAALGLAGVAVRAGARSAMGSLWSVSDQAASELVVDFYSELGRRDTSKAEALRRAQLALLAQKRFAHPYYWAPFLMINNWL